jgi:hypothetical protein
MCQVPENISLARWWNCDVLFMNCASLELALIGSSVPTRTSSSLSLISIHARRFRSNSPLSAFKKWKRLKFYSNSKTHEMCAAHISIEFLTHHWLTAGNALGTRIAKIQRHCEIFNLSSLIFHRRRQFLCKFWLLKNERRSWGEAWWGFGAWSWLELGEEDFGMREACRGGLTAAGVWWRSLWHLRGFKCFWSTENGSNVAFSNSSNVPQAYVLKAVQMFLIHSKIVQMFLEQSASNVHNPINLL